MEEIYVYQVNLGLLRQYKVSFGEGERINKKWLFFGGRFLGCFKLKKNLI